MVNDVGRPPTAKIVAKFLVSGSITMVSKPIGTSTPNVSEPSTGLEKMAAELIQCVHEFWNDYGPPFEERCAFVAFGNAVYMSIEHRERATALLTEIQGAGLPWDPDAVVPVFQNFEMQGDWIAEIGKRLSTLWGTAKPGIHCDNIQRILSAVAAGLIAVRALPDLARVFRERWNSLNSESRFLVSRLMSRFQCVKRARPPFIEYANGFYEPGSTEQEVLTLKMWKVLSIARTLPDPWKIGLWAQTGWHEGRTIGTEMPDVLEKLVAGIPVETIAAYVELYRRTVLRTTATDGSVRPEHATLRYFGTTSRDIYARHYCSGEQPRFLARAAFDYAFWMGLLSTQPIPASHD